MMGGEGAGGGVGVGVGVSGVGGGLGKWWLDSQPLPPPLLCFLHCLQFFLLVKVLQFTSPL